MNRKLFIVGSVLALGLTALLVVPAWLAAAERSADDDAADQQRSARGFLGVGLKELTPELQVHFGAPEGSGVLVASVGDSSPAATGIRVGDVITAIDGLAVDSARDLGREVRNRPGQTVTIELYRDGEPRQVTVTLGERQAHGWEHPAGRSPEEWAEWAERWERWGEEIGEKWGRWGEEFGQRWGEEHADKWQRLAEEFAERGEDLGEIGEEIGREVEQALSEIDWDEIGSAVEESMKALEEVDWEAMSERIERRMEELERRLEENRESSDDSS
jgi:hypothetical protein